MPIRGAPRTSMSRMARAASSGVSRLSVAKACGRRVWSMMPTAPRCPSAGGRSTQMVRVGLPSTFIVSLPGYDGHSLGSRRQVFPEAGEAVVPEHGIGVGQGKGGDPAALLRRRGRAADVALLSGRIAANDKEAAARSDPAMAGAGGKNQHVAGGHVDVPTSGPAEGKPRRAGGDA